MSDTSKQPLYNDKRNVLNRASLVEPIVRHRIQDSIFYKQHLYLTNEATILPVIVQHVKYVAGTDAMGRPAPFICCLLRLLELEPAPEIVSVYLTQLEYNEFKYLTAMILIYIRMVAASDEVYNTLDGYFQDLRKLRIKHRNPQFSDASIPVHYGLTHMDEWVDDLLTKDRVVDLILPRLVPRQVLVERHAVKPRQYHVETPQDAGNESSSEESDYESDSD